MRKLYAILLLLPGGAAEAQRPPTAPPVESVASAWRTKYDPYRVDDYAALVRMVEGGIPAVLYVGVKDESAGSYVSHMAVPSGFRGLADGVYDCYCESDGTAKMRPRVPPVAPRNQGFIVGTIDGKFDWLLTPPGLPQTGRVVEIGGQHPVDLGPLEPHVAERTGRTGIERWLNRSAADCGPAG